MHGNRLTSIPESYEQEERDGESEAVLKWVPKKKHELLKAKYKCLKKLFQIYDASVIGILPGQCPDQELDQEDRTYRRKRSHRTKTDACAATSDISCGDVSIDEDNTVTTAAARELNLCSSQTLSETDKYKDVTTQDSKETLNTSEKESECTQTIDNNRESLHPVPHLMTNEKRKLTRFQTFIQRLFGIKSETYRSYGLSGHVYAASDNNISHWRRRLRFRRLRRAKKISSDSGLRDMRSPVMLSYVQSVQRNYLMDTTQRQCPIVGCRMISYGIINYNDHLNLCHFTERKFICHYCHEGFELETDKYIHENEHIGINKFNFNDYSARQSIKKASNTQTDPQLGIPEEKLKKLVSFFDKIVDNEELLIEMQNNRCSESNLRRFQRSSKPETDTVTTNEGSVTNYSDKRTVSCENLRIRKSERSATLTNSEVTSKYQCSSVKCRFCGENFDYRRQLSLHMDLEHRFHNKFSKYHSCAGITNPHKNKCNEERPQTELREVNTSSTLAQEVSRRKSEESLSCDRSTNIIYYESVDMVRKPSVINTIAKKVRDGIQCYKWEPGTKIIRV